MRLDQGLDIGRDQVMPSERELGFESQLLGARLELLQPHTVALRERLVYEVRQRRTPPQPQCIGQHDRR